MLARGQMAGKADVYVFCRSGSRYYLLKYPDALAPVLFLLFFLVTG
jgi:hypothetical protein